MRLASAIVIAVLGLTARGYAQAPGQTPPRGPVAQPAPAPAENPGETRRERVKKRIRAIRAIAVTEELGLDTADAGKLFPVLAKYDDDFDRLLLVRGQLQKRLDAAGGMRDPKAIDKLIDEALANQRAFWDLEDKRIAELRKILTPAQVARLLIVLPALERKIQNQLRQAIKPRPRNARDDDDDDDVEPGERPAPRNKRGGNPTPTRPDKNCDPFDTRHGC
jgi:hypothetical protein